MTRCFQSTIRGDSDIKFIGEKRKVSLSLPNLRKLKFDLLQAAILEESDEEYELADEPKETNNQRRRENPVSFHVSVLLYFGVDRFGCRSPVAYSNIPATSAERTESRVGVKCQRLRRFVCGVAHGRPGVLTPR